jgi:hypothetical protein
MVVEVAVVQLVEVEVLPVQVVVVDQDILMGLLL